jgi:hypothetical protein
LDRKATQKKIPLLAAFLLLCHADPQKTPSLSFMDGSPEMAALYQLAQQLNL